MGLIEFGAGVQRPAQHQLRQPRRVADRGRGRQRRRRRLHRSSRRSRTRSARRPTRPRSQTVEIYKADKLRQPAGRPDQRLHPQRVEPAPAVGPRRTVPYTRSGAAGYPDYEPLQRPRRLPDVPAPRGRHHRRRDHLPLHLGHADGLVHRAGHRATTRWSSPTRCAWSRSCERPPSAARRDAARRGQSLVEFAISVPVFMLLLFGMLEFGFAFNHHLTLEYATREGARTGAALADAAPTASPATHVDDADHRRGPARPQSPRLADRPEPRSARSGSTRPTPPATRSARPDQHAGSTRAPGPTVDGVALDFKSNDRRLGRLPGRHPEQRRQPRLDRGQPDLQLPPDQSPLGVFLGGGRHAGHLT